MPLLICLFNRRFHLTTGQNKTHTLGGWCDTGHYQLGRLNLSWDRRDLNYFSSEIRSFVVATYLIRVKVLRSVPFTPLLCISFPLYNLFFSPECHFHLPRRGFSIYFRGEYWNGRKNERWKLERTRTAAPPVLWARWWEMKTLSRKRA